MSALIIRKIFIFTALLLYLLVTGCSGNDDHEESIHFYDLYLKKQVLEQLKRENIKFELDGDTIWYSHEEGKKVTKVYDTALLNFPMTYIFQTQESKNRFVENLKRLNVPILEQSFDDGKYVIRISKRYKDIMMNDRGE